MIITALTERDGHVSYSSETALRREVANFIERGDGARMIVNARPSRAELDDDEEPLEEIDRSVACATLREAWAEVSLVLHHGGHLELQALPPRPGDGEYEEAAA
jgi:hypothetical protein